MSKDNFGDRMKGYENTYRAKLPKRMPVIIRLDGKAFHTYTKGMEKPFDEKLVNAFWETCKYLCQNIMGCKMAYHQSDEITLLLTNYDKLTTESWFDNNIQKMVSVASSMATMKFNQCMQGYTDKVALFDARAFVLPQDEVNNVFLWRQQDATKNSVSMVAHNGFGHKALQNLNGSKKQEKLFQERNINWNNLPTWQKRGACIVKKYYQKGDVLRSRWVVDKEIPIFSQDRNYIEQYVYLK
ncbi:tRNAHis-5'-guanylyltransferase [Staphylococcus phage PMBT8]|nr:tRNAHis-5'-guanylyltransferase [Staphylococcus phage PMBT8]